MLMVITGKGKGKTTAAIGAAVRAVGDGRRVLMIQFIKGPWRSGEDVAQLMLSPYFQIIKTGLGFVGILGDTRPREEHEAAARAGLALARDEMRSGRWDMLVLDEVNNAIHLGLLEEEDVAAFAASLPEGMDLIMTGRDARQSLIDMADIVSDIREVKHPFSEGTEGTKGIEW